MKSSDISLKSDLRNIESPLEKILNLRAYQYNFNQKTIQGEDTITIKVPEYGFVSKEVKETLKDVAITEEGKEGILLMDYDQIIPILVAGIQEQQSQINSLEATIAMLMSRAPESNADMDDTAEENQSDMSKLDNATPKPFNNSTDIGYSLGANINSASIKIWNMQGVEKKVFTLTNEQKVGKITVDSSHLSVSGSYIYALVINGAIISSKTLVFTK